MTLRPIIGISEGYEMTIGVLASTQERARHITRTDPFLREKFGDELIPLSPRSQGHRGRQLEAIFVAEELHHDLWVPTKHL